MQNVGLTVTRIDRFCFFLSYCCQSSFAGGDQQLLIWFGSLWQQSGVGNSLIFKESDALGRVASRCDHMEYTVECYWPMGKHFETLGEGFERIFGQFVLGRKQDHDREVGPQHQDFWWTWSRHAWPLKMLPPWQLWMPVPKQGNWRWEKIWWKAPWRMLQQWFLRWLTDDYDIELRDYKIKSLQHLTVVL